MNDDKVRWVEASETILVRSIGFALAQAYDIDPTDEGVQCLTMDVVDTSGEHHLLVMPVDSQIVESITSGMLGEKIKALVKKNDLTNILDDGITD